MKIQRQKIEKRFIDFTIKKRVIKIKRNLRSSTNQ